MDAKEKLAKLQNEKMLKRSTLVKVRRNINLLQRNNSKGNPNRLELEKKQREVTELTEAIEALDKEISALEKDVN